MTEIDNSSFEKWSDSMAEKIVSRAELRQYPYLIPGEVVGIMNLVEKSVGSKIDDLSYNIGEEMYGEEGASANAKNDKRDEIFKDVFGEEAVAKLHSMFSGNDLLRVRLTLSAFLASYQEKKKPLEHPSFNNLNNRLEPGLLKGVSESPRSWPRAIAKVTAKSIKDALKFIAEA